MEAQAVHPAAVWTTIWTCSVQTPFFITSNVRIRNHFPNAIEDWVQGLNSGIYKFKGRHLVPDNEEEIEIGQKFLTVQQKIRVLPELESINMDFTIFNNKLAITSLEDNPFIVVIESVGIVDSMRPIFEIAWQKGKELK